jgi:diadenosine tetraphosphatase ApaH/serine/threonine PP2A family protein phosphatase
MRALILSDIHANLDALQAVLEAAPAHDTVWNLGDVVGYGGAPNEAVECVRNLGRVHVRGNHDRVCSGIASSDSFNVVAYKAVQWTRSELTPVSLNWLTSMAQGPVMTNCGSVSCVHGSPLDEDDYVLGMDDAAAPLLYSQTRITFFGHSHIQGCFAHCENATAENSRYEFLPETMSEPMPRFDHGDQPVHFKLHLRPESRYLINPGSVGQPRDEDWRAAFALYDDEAMEIDFHRVPYDLAAAQNRIRKAGLPARLATRLSEGR